MKRIVLTAALLLMAALPSFATTWTRVTANTKTGTTGTGSSVAAATFGAALTNPSVIVVWCDTTDSATLNAPTDTASNTYNAVDTAAASSGTTKGRLYYANNTSTISSNVVQCNLSGSVINQTNIVAAEWKGNAGAVSVDVSAKAANTISGGTPQPAASFTTTGSTDLIVVGVRSTASETFTIGSGYSAVGAGSTRDQVEEQLNAGAGTYQNNFTGLGNNTWVLMAVALKESGGGSPPACVRSMSLMGVGCTQ
jgi:hypothetical protein